jgi:hypothetical protein
VLKYREKVGVLEFDCEEPRPLLFTKIKSQKALFLPSMAFFCQLIGSIALSSYERYKLKRRV